MQLVFLILLGVTLLAVLRKVFSIVSLQNTKHLTVEQIRKFARGNMNKKEEDYTKIITHLGSCEACKDRLDAHIDGKVIE